MNRPPPRKNSSPRVLAILEDLGQRPAMNGGFQRLMAQQDEQTAELKVQSADLATLKQRLEPIESWIATWDKRFGGIQKLGYAILIAVLASLAKDLVGRIQIVLH